MISEASTKRAIKHLTVFGDTDIFPALLEIRFFADNEDKIAEKIAKLTPGSYTPQSSLEFLVPKSRHSFRIAHQLSAQDTLIYLAAVLENAPKLETLRVPAADQAAFSYRYKEGEGPKVFEVGGTYHDWMLKLAEFGGPVAAENDQRVVIVTDISDFYQRIYHHRLENILDECGNNPSIRLVKKIFKSVRANQSFGIPVGQTASRFLAELVLNDIDKFLIHLGVAHTRYVDDFRIIVENQQIAHSTLCQLAENLMISEGLSLNGSKTEFLDVKELQNSSLKRLDDVFSNKDMIEFQNFLRITYEDDTTLNEDEDDVAGFMFANADNLAEKISDFIEYGTADLSVYKAIFRAIKIIGGVDPDKIIKHLDMFIYSIPREVCLALSKMSRDDEEKILKVKHKMLELLNSSPFRDLNLCRYWILDLFIMGVLPFDWNDFREYDFSRSIVERRALHLLLGRLGQTQYFRKLKTGFNQLSDWEKPAFLIGAQALPHDEYKKWLISVKDSVPGPFEDIFIEWLLDNYGKMDSILKY